MNRWSFAILHSLNAACSENFLIFHTEGSCRENEKNKLPRDEAIFDFLADTADHVMLKKIRIELFSPLPVLVNLRLGHQIHQV